MAKPTLFEWATTPTSPIIYPASAFVTGGYPATYQIPAAEYNATLNRLGLWNAYINTYLGSTDGDIKATTIRPYVGTSNAGITLNAGTSGATVGVTIDGVDNGVKIAVSSAGPTAEHSWEWKKDGRLAVSLTDSIDWSTGAIRNSGGTVTYASWATGADGWAMSAGATAGQNATSGLWYGYPAASRPTVTHDVSPFMWPFQVVNGTRGSIADGTYRLSDSSGSYAYAVAPLPRSGILTGAGTVFRVTTMAATGLAVTGAATEAYMRLMSRSRASWSTTTVEAQLTTGTPTWSGSVVLDETTKSYWIELVSDDPGVGAAGFQVDLCTIGIQPYTADV